MASSSETNGVKENEVLDKADNKVVNGKGEEKPARRTKKGWRKPADKPKRPLSAYNLFFRDERERILSSAAPKKGKKGEGGDAAKDEGGGDAKDGVNKEEEGLGLGYNVGGDEQQAEQEHTENGVAVEEDGKKKPRKHRRTHGKIGFAALARNIAEKWKTMAPAERAPFEARAAFEKVRYAKALQDWEEKRRLNQGQEQEPVAVPMRLEDMFALHQPALAQSEEQPNNEDADTHVDQDPNADHEQLSDQDDQHEQTSNKRKTNPNKANPNKKKKKKKKKKRKKSQSLDTKAMFFLTSIKQPGENDGSEQSDDDDDDDESDDEDDQHEHQHQQQTDAKPHQQVVTKKHQKHYDQLAAQQELSGQQHQQQRQKWSRRHQQQTTDQTHQSPYFHHQQHSQPQSNSPYFPKQQQTHNEKPSHPIPTKDKEQQTNTQLAKPPPSTAQTEPQPDDKTKPAATAGNGNGFAVEATLDKKAKSFLTSILHQYSTGPL